MDSLLDAAHSLLQANTELVEYEGETWRYSAPSRSVYPHQWLWDSCFHAIVWSHFDLTRACDELRSILHWQHADGLVPHMVFWRSEGLRKHFWHYLESADGWRFRQKRPWTSALTQPPVLATAVERLVQAGVDDFLDDALPRLERYYLYLAERRDPDRDGLISTICQYETGLDYSPAYDRSLGADPARPKSILRALGRVKLANKLRGYDLDRIFARGWHCEDVLVNTIWIDNLAALKRLAELAGRSDLGDWAEQKRAQALQTLLERSWDADRGLFFNLDGADESRPTVKTIQCLLPLLLEDLPPEMTERLLEHLTAANEFWTPFPVPSVALDEATYSEDSRLGGKRLIWRGPLSMNTNWFLWQGLVRHSETRLAAQLAERSLDCIERGGFNEFFSASVGEPVGADRFGWATLAVEMAAAV